MTASVELLGAGWGRWRGSWSSGTTLESDGTGWRLVHGIRTIDRYDSFECAVDRLWTDRLQHGDDPWAVGWLSYEACAELGGSLPAHPWRGAFPSGWWLLEPTREVSPRIEPTETTSAAFDVAWTASLDDAAFRQAVEAIRARIAAGDVYQVNLTRRFTAPGWTGGLDLPARVLRAAGWPPHAARFRLDRGELLCGSMELLLRRRGDRAETRPIKGTRPRGATPEGERRLARELAGDAKERAELAMIVDLERNDLGRCAVPGSVAVPDAGSVRVFPSVLHRVARVTATVPVATPWWELLAAVVPGGSVTGCPKRAAMEVIRTLEPVPRGPYTGALGVIAGTGDLELALPIRTAWWDLSALHLASGCGIVWDSEPSREEAESRLKVAPWLGLGRSG